MKVTYYHRRPFDGNFSIERVFRDVRAHLPETVESEVATARYQSRGLWRRIYNAVEAVFRQGDVNHITGDVHYLTYFLRKRKTLLTIHDCVTLERLKGFRKKVFFFLWYWLPARRSALVSVISESTKRELLCYLKIPPDKIRVVHDPVPADFRPHPAEFHSTKPVILQIGTSPNKNLLRVAEALHGIPCHLRIVGDLSPEQIHTLQKCLIEYSSGASLSDEEIVEEYQHCDIVVFVSTYEGFGLPILEANATGRPVVTGNILSMPEVAGEAACLVDPFDTEAIRQGILRVIEDRGYREELVRHGFRNVERFRPEAIAAQYVKLYEELAGL